MKEAKILIVQDDFLEAERLRLLLERSGHSVVGVVRRTRAANQMADQHRPHLAIVDLMLEVDVDGIHTGTGLAKRGIKILITTGFPDSVVQAAGGQELACAIVKKPYTDQDILAGVSACLA